MTCSHLKFFSLQMLSKKVDTLSKAMEVEAKKMRREVIVMEKEVAAMRVDKDQDRRTRRLSMSKEPVNSSSQRLSGRWVRFYNTVLCPEKYFVLFWIKGKPHNVCVIQQRNLAKCLVAHQQNMEIIIYWSLVLVTGTSNYWVQIPSYQNLVWMVLGYKKTVLATTGAVVY